MQLPINKKFGEWTVISLDRRNKYGIYFWNCSCSCGNKKSISIGDLNSGHSRSCGCTKLLTHGMTKGGKSRFYRCWQNMQQRCENPLNHHYKNYGGRGIRNLWKNAASFKDDLFPSYLKHCKTFGEKNTTLERKDVNGNYCKENCKWSSRKEQMNNLRSTERLIYKNKEYTFSELSEKTGIKKKTLWSRIKTLKWDINQAVQPIKFKHFNA